MSAWFGVVRQGLSAPLITTTLGVSSGRYTPDGYEWVSGRCPNQGHACNCPGYCQPKLVRSSGHTGRHRKS